jgi:hypothetical protein
VTQSQSRFLGVLGPLAITALVGSLVLGAANLTRAGDSVACSVGPGTDSTDICPEATILWQGSDVWEPDSDVPDWARKAYAVSIPAFPDLRSCIAPSDEPNRPVTEATLRWDAFRTNYDVEVCFFRLFFALGEKEAAENWLIDNRFRTHGFRTSSRYVNGTALAEEVLDANWSIKDKGALWGTSKWNRLTAFLRMRGGGIQISYSPAGELSGVNVYGNSQWN